LQTQEKKKDKRKRRKSIRKKEERKKKRIHDLGTRIFVPLLYKFKVNLMIIIYKNS